MPQKCAGVRIEPPMSLPSSRPVRPAASAAAAPPEDPPGVRVVSQGLWVQPKTALYDCRSIAKVGRLVLPNTTAPAATSRCTAVALLEGTCPASSGAPEVVRKPAVSNESLIVIGTPCSAPHDSPRASAASAAAARVQARSASSVTTAFRTGLKRSMRRRDSASSSRLLMRRSRRAAASFDADSNARSDTVLCLCAASAATR